MDMQRGFRIGSWAVSPLTGEIESAGRAVHLEPKVMEVLVVLAGKAEFVVLREELLDKVWGARAAISDEPLTRCIAQLRQSLGDSSRDPKFIQTVPKRGYRLMVPVSPVDVSASEPPPNHSGQPIRPVPKRSDVLRPWQAVGLIGTLAVIGSVAYISLPFILSPDDSESLDLCYIEQVEQPFRIIDDGAYADCTQGLMEMGERTASSLEFAMDYFRKAIDAEPDYGSAIVNLARSMVLLPTYQESPDPGVCSYDNSGTDQDDCNVAARKILELYGGDVPYIEKYVYGVAGYIYTRQRDWPIAEVSFERAFNERDNDADMWQWYSQFRAAVGDLTGALEAIEKAYELNSNSGVILDRYGVILMWLGRYDDARMRFEEAAQYPHVPYEASHLIWSIRSEQWDEVGRLLERHAGPRRENATWIDEFLAGLSDTQQLERAVAAVDIAIQANELSGQYIYGAWALLQQPDRAIEAALMLLEDDAEPVSVEFFFAPETRAMRQQERFIEIVRKLGLDDYWSADEANCPPLFSREDERNWCN